VIQLLIEFVDQVRCKKLRNNIRATVAIRVQQLSETQDQLLAELKTWRETETTKFTQVEQLCDQVLDQTPTIGSSDEEPIPSVSQTKEKYLPMHRLPQLYAFSPIVDGRAEAVGIHPADGATVRHDPLDVR